MVKETVDRRINTDAKMHDDDAKRLPHERDESPEGRAKAPRGIINQAAADVARGLVDTDLRGQPGGSQAAPPSDASGEQATPLPDADKSMRDRRHSA